MKADNCIHGEVCKSRMWYYPQDAIERFCNRCEYFAELKTVIICKTECLHYPACLRIQKLNGIPYTYCEGCEEFKDKNSQLGEIMRDGQYEFCICKTHTVRPALFLLTENFYL